MPFVAYSYDTKAQRTHTHLLHDVDARTRQPQVLASSLLQLQILAAAETLEYLERSDAAIGV